MAGLGVGPRPVQDRMPSLGNVPQLSSATCVKEKRADVVPLTCAIWDVDGTKTRRPHDAGPSPCHGCPSDASRSARPESPDDLRLAGPALGEACFKSPAADAVPGVEARRYLSMFTPGDGL